MTKREYKEVLNLIEHGYLRKAIQVFLKSIEDNDKLDHIVPELSLLLSQLSILKELGEDANWQDI